MVEGRLQVLPRDSDPGEWSGTGHLCFEKPFPGDPDVRQRVKGRGCPGDPLDWTTLQGPRCPTKLPSRLGSTCQCPNLGQVSYLPHASVSPPRKWMSPSSEKWAET